MCGIAGFLTKSIVPNGEMVLRQMLDRLSHRGPNGMGLWLGDHVGLGHRRLSILDVSKAGHQPMQDSDGHITVTYNGEIYNFRALRRELEREYGAVFRSECDTEILPIGYLHWGDKLFEKIEGMFALAIWDGRHSELTLARDGAGIKPLYVYQSDHTLFFASEIKAFLALPDQQFQVSPVDFHGYLANGYVDPARSLLHSISQLPPGTIRRLNKSGACIFEQRYWQPARCGTVTSLEEAEDAIAATLKTVVSDMMISDVPIGILQSGGIDSSLITLSSRGHNIPLFTASFEEKGFDESRDANLVSQKLGLEHHVVAVDAQTSPTETVRALAWAYDGQLSDSSGFAFYRLCDVIKKHVTVALSGEGGDEFFAGYPTYRASSIAGAIGHMLPRPLWRALGMALLRRNDWRQGRVSLSERVARFMLGISGGGPNYHAEWRRYLFAHEEAGLFGPDMRPFLSSDPLAAYRQEIDSANGRTSLDKWLLGDQKYYLPGDMLAKTDRVSMAHSLEIRVPFIDRRMMNLAGDIHHSLLTSLKGPDKRALRTTLARLGVEEQISAGQKRGFNVPIARMLVGGLFDLCERIFEAEPDRFSNLLNPSGVRGIWRRHKAGGHANHYLLWSLLIFALWREEASL